ncbi:MAG: plasmid mobilization protein [Burkholderiales bacterium]
MKPLTSDTETRTKYIKIRVTHEELLVIKANADNADKSVSGFIRDRAFGSKEIKVAAIQQIAAKNRNSEIAFELRKIGAMMRGFYPKDDQCWNNEDKRRYWDAMETLLQRAHAIEQRKY